MPYFAVYWEHLWQNERDLNLLHTEVIVFLSPYLFLFLFFFLFFFFFCFPRIERQHFHISRAVSIEVERGVGYRANVEKECFFLVAFVPNQQDFGRVAAS